ncbi:MAG: hypothetical protein Q9174_005621, partial [Haloplaca sp. 1 TL-2023]
SSQLIYYQVNVNIMTFAQAIAQRNSIARYIIALLNQANGSADARKSQQIKTEGAIVPMQPGIGTWGGTILDTATRRTYLILKLAHLGAATCKQIDRLIQVSINYRAKKGKGAVG